MIFFPLDACLLARTNGPPVTEAVWLPAVAGGGDGDLEMEMMKEGRCSVGYKYLSGTVVVQFS